MKIYTVYDKKGKFYDLPFYQREDESAKRAMKMALSKNQLMTAYAEDYQLWQIGSFNEKTAQITFPKKPDFVCELIDLIPSDLSMLKGSREVTKDTDESNKVLEETKENAKVDFTNKLDTLDPEAVGQDESK